MTIQLDYGGFDPAFVGITTRFSTDSAWRAFQEHVGSGSPFRGSEDTPDQKFEWLAVTSVLIHELRHFHDFLLSPYSARIFKHRVQLTLNALQLLPNLIARSGNCLPVPISAWCRMEGARRSRELKYLPPRRSGDVWAPIDLPVIHDLDSDHDEMVGTIFAEKGLIEGLIRAVSQGQRKIDEFTSNSDRDIQAGSLQPWQVFELSGFLIQIQDIWQTYGEEHTLFFLDYMSQKSNNPYWSIFRFAKSPWDVHGIHFDDRVISAMAFWSICGSFRTDSWSACPSHRLFQLVNQMARQNAEIEYKADLWSLWDQWSEQTGLSRVQDGLNETVFILRNLCKRTEEFATKDCEPWMRESFALTVLRVAYGVLRSSEHMVERLRSDPGAYVVPHRYVENPTDYVNPVLRQVFDAFEIEMEKSPEELESRGFKLLWYRWVDDRALIASMIRPFELTEHRFLDETDVADFAELVGTVDFAVATKSRARFEVQFPGRLYFKEAKVTPIDVSHLAV